MIKINLKLKEEYEFDLKPFHITDEEIDALLEQLCEKKSSIRIINIKKDSNE